MRRVHGLCFGWPSSASALTIAVLLDAMLAWKAPLDGRRQATFAGTAQVLRLFGLTLEARSGVREEMSALALSSWRQRVRWRPVVWGRNARREGFPACVRHPAAALARL